MTFGQLEIFASLAEAKSFTTTAKRLGISQPAVSHSLKSLEKELQVSLFDRHGTLVALTPIGQQLLERAREILSLSHTMQQEAAAFRGIKLGSLRIGSFGATSSLQILPDLLEAFYLEYPGVEVLIEEAADEVVVRWIEERRVDLGFVVLPDERFETFPIASDQFVALVAKNSPLAKRPNLSLKDLCGDPFIMPESDSARIVGRLFADAHLHPKTRYRTSQMLSAISMVARGQGVSVVADMALPPRSPEDGWVSKPLEPMITRSIGLALHQSAAHSPAAEAFVKMAQRLKY